MILDKRILGQVFTPIDIANRMCNLIKKKGSILEPSCGAGIFIEILSDRDIIGIEIDKNVAHKNALIVDFFEYSIENKFDTIIGNPPYVRYQDIKGSTKELIKDRGYDKRTNLSVLFMDKCLEHLTDHGELIFIVPRDFLKSTSARKLNNKLYEQGTITDMIELGDKPIFKNACPNCVIFRFEKGNLTHITNDSLKEILVNGNLYFLKNEYPVPFGDIFEVKVGAVSGADKYFESDKGNKEFVYSKTVNTGNTKRMYYNVATEELSQYKEQLLKRKLKGFSEDNWYKWGRTYPESDKKRIYVNLKTRIKKPFFIHSCTAWDGSILALFPKKELTDLELKELCLLLNDNVDWNQLGFLCDNRFIFSQKALENTILPLEFKKFSI